MRFIKKLMLTAGLVSGLVFSAGASAVTITDTYNPNDIYLSNGQSTSFTHTLAGFVAGVDSLISATLDLYFRDDSALDGGETYQVKIGLNQVFTDNNLQDYWVFFVPFAGSVTETVALSTASLADLADGAINLIIKSTQGDFYFEKSVLTAQVTKGSAAVPEPATIAILGLGLLGLAASRRKAGKKA